MEINQISIIGAGAMGSGIAQVCLTAGLAVQLIDTDPAALERGYQRINEGFGRLIAKGGLSESERAARLTHLQATGDLTEVNGELVIEAISEQLDVKLATFASLDHSCPPTTILASNTSSLSITRLAAATGRPERVVGMHFFNPAPVMKLVEVVRGLVTSEATIAIIMTLAERLGKTPVEARDTPGFIANRVMVPAINEAIFALMEGVATREAIDTTLTLGFNHPIGPLRLADLVGLDVCLAVMEILHHDFGDDKYRPCPLLRTMVAAGHLGRKAGRGFYEYNTADRQPG